MIVCLVRFPIVGGVLACNGIIWSKFHLNPVVYGGFGASGLIYGSIFIYLQGVPLVFTSIYSFP